LKNMPTRKDVPLKPVEKTKTEPYRDLMSKDPSTHEIESK